MAIMQTKGGHRKWHLVDFEPGRPVVTFCGLLAFELDTGTGGAFDYLTPDDSWAGDDKCKTCQRHLESSDHVVQ